jgi:hypothetical protein
MLLLKTMLFNLLNLERRFFMKRRLGTILLSFVVLIFLVALLFPGLASADRYVCINPQTDEAKIIQSPYQCMKPSILSTITNADFARMFPGSVSQTKSGSALPTMREEPGVGAGARCRIVCTWVFIDKCKEYPYCCCIDGSNCKIGKVRKRPGCTSTAK